MHIAVCDDNSIDREIIVTMLRDYAVQKSIHIDITEYSSGLGMIYDIEDRCCFDVIFLDIYMDKILGIDVAHTLRNEINYDGAIVFFTATAEFAVDSYDVEAAGYLVKPIGYEKIFAVMDKIISSYKAETYSVKRYSSVIHIPIDEILYVNSSNNTCIVHRKDGSSHTVYKRLDEIQKELPGSNFLRCHQSYLINMDYIRRADRDFEIVTGEIISIRQRDIKNIRSVYLNYLSRRRKNF